MLRLLYKKKGSGGSTLADGKSGLRKTIMVGQSFQAKVPKELSPYTEEPPCDKDVLLWDPDRLSKQQVESYLVKSQSIENEKRLSIDPALQVNMKFRGEEQFLYILVQCDYNVEEAISRVRSS